MTGTAHTIRPARPGELKAVVAVDDAASTLYADFGMPLGLTGDHPFAVAEGERWGVAIEGGRLFVAVDDADVPVGFAALGSVDGEPYLDQLSVHPHVMRRGIGSALLQRAIEWAGGRPLWLTTYSHVPFNRPFYERHGFEVVAEDRYGPELKAITRHQRAALPAPEQRVAMIRR